MRALRRALSTNTLDNPAVPLFGYMGVLGVLCVLSGGVAPQSVESHAPQWLTYAWAASLAVGGILAVVGCLSAKGRAESAGLALLVFGLGLFALALVVAEDTGQWLGTLTLAACCLLRMRALHKARRAQKMARRILAADGEVPPWTS